MLTLYNAYEILTGKWKGKKLLGICRCRKESVTKAQFMAIKCNIVIS